MPGNKQILYDPEDQALFDLHKWHISDTGYAVWRGIPKGSDKKITVRLHRLIAQPEPGQVVDHLNGNKLDNRRKNLRNCTSKENSQNRHTTKGVCFDTTRSKWLAVYKTKYLGRYDTEEEAKKAYQLAKSGVEYQYKQRLHPHRPQNIFKNKSNKGWQVRYTDRISRRRIYLGTFPTLEEAQLALTRKRG